MATHTFNELKKLLATADVDLENDDIRVALLMSNTTADTENDDIEVVSDITTLDEMDGANYVRKALTSLAVNLDNANDRAEFDADDVTWTALGAGTRSIAGVLVFLHDTNDDASVPLAWIEFANPVTADGTDFTIKWNDEGIIQLT